MLCQQAHIPFNLGKLTSVSSMRRVSTNANSTKKQIDLLHNFNRTYPEGSRYLTPQHFYQVSVRKWLQKSPRPLTLAQIVKYGQKMSKQKIIASANHVAEELTIRFAHRIRQMQLLPYRLMGHPSFLDTYEQYIDSFEMLRQVGVVKTLEDNEKLIQIGQQLLQKHTQVVTNVIFGVREILSQPHKPEDVELLDELATSLLTSRLSRRVLVKQHVSLTKVWLEENQKKLESSKTSYLKRSSEDSSQVRNVLKNHETVGEVLLNCRIIDVVSAVESRTKANLSQVFNKSIDEMPKIVIEGNEADFEATFPYIWPHFEFAFGVLLVNSLEACLRRNVVDPIVVTVSANSDSVLVRVSDRGGGLSADQQKYIWSVADPSSAKQTQITPRELANHQFFSLLFPAEEHSQDLSRNPGDCNLKHLGLGLALSRLYVEYWGGALEIHSLDGFGCDALLRVSRTGSKRENLRLNKDKTHVY